MTNSLAGGSRTIGTSIVEFATSAGIVNPLSENVKDTFGALESLVYTGGWTNRADAIEACQITLPISSG